MRHKTKRLLIRVVFPFLFIISGVIFLCIQVAKEKDCNIVADLGTLGRFRIYGGGYLQQNLCHGQPWEPHVTTWIDQLVHGQGNTIDVGANIGYHTVSLARRSIPHKTHAFESNPSTRVYLYENILLNNLRNVEVHGALLPEEEDPQATIDAAHIDNVVFIKIDCGGCEQAVLLGASDTIRRYRPVIELEIWDDRTRAANGVHSTRQDILDMLFEFGYRPPQVHGWDYLFLPLSIPIVDHTGQFQPSKHDLMLSHDRAVLQALQDVMCHSDPRLPDASGSLTHLIHPDPLARLPNPM
ncbi:hypothetical protein PAPYR_9325 [Paratrimastix pyriformis]|uniref:Methyltransferase FkbM domain-containing protein n=1 Tax=Paratrimastix pyriformis TaxID=342808 RepID=A0ABQ8UEB3_9EUKA|nr:hypothetical protein PAPYR_9325 [Paratrimastix pyriformis]